MIWTNKYHLPEPIARAIMHDDYDHKDDPNYYSVTEIINPIRLATLMRRHRHEVVKDVSDGLWLLLGSAVHYVLEKAGCEDGIQEERLEKKYGDLTLGGKADLWLDGEILDWKITSVWKMLRGDSFDWECQLNCYAALYRDVGFDVNVARVWAILRDFRTGEMLKDKDYPPVPFINKFITKWTPEQTDDYIHRRLFHLSYWSKKTDDELPMCNKNEKWTRGDKWAVMGDWRKTAIKVFNSDFGDAETEARQFVNDCSAEYSKKGELSVEHRPGTDVRCERFCDAAPWCSHGKQYIKEDDNDRL